MKTMKEFNIMYNIGRAKYVINYHNGIDTHPDGSRFFGIVILSNKKELQKATNKLIKEGYVKK